MQYLPSDLDGGVSAVLGEHELLCCGQLKSTLVGKGCPAMDSVMQSEAALGPLGLSALVHLRFGHDSGNL